MLNKLKEIFTPDKVINRGKEWPDERQGTLPTDWQPSDDVEVSENKSSDDVEVSEIWMRYYMQLKQLVMIIVNSNGIYIKQLQILLIRVIVF